MIKFPIKTTSEEVIFNLPTSVEEISAEYLQNITAGVNIADHYSLVALVYHDTLSNIIFQSTSKKKDATIGVVPIFVKCGKTDSDYVNSIKCADKIIIGGSQLQLGYRVAVPHNDLSLDKFVFYCSKSARNIYQDSLNLVHKSKEVYFLEFKLVANSDIVGNYTNVEIEPTEDYFTYIPNVRGEA